MTAIVDNNLSVSLARRMGADQSQVDVRHVVDSGLQHATDDALRSRWRSDNIVWVTRDQDFRLDAPDPWAVVWIDCHNPRLAFLRDVVAPAVAGWLPQLRRGARLRVTESMIVLA